MQEIGDYSRRHHSRISKIICDVPWRSGEAQVKTPGLPGVTVKTGDPSSRPRPRAYSEGRET